MKISIFGLGYVGCVGLACFAENGNEIVGVDIDENKIKSINRGQSPIVENGINELIEANFRNKRIGEMGTAVGSH